MTLRNLSRRFGALIVAVLISILVGATCTGCVKKSAQRVCVPAIDSTQTVVIEQCGQPLAVYTNANLKGTVLVQEEWDYQYTMVGFIDGTVAYVLTFESGAQ